MNYPQKITVTQLLENNGLVMANEIVKRYNSHEQLLLEINRLQDERFYKRVYAITGIISTLALIILIYNVI